MIKKYLFICLAALLLTACGGSSSKDDSLFGDKETDTPGLGQDDTAGDTDNEVSTKSDIDNPRLGTGFGDNFSSASLDITLTDLSAGGTTNVSVNIIDLDNGNNKIVSQSYKIVFSSTCADTTPARAEFNNSEVISSSGSASVIYTAKGCSGVDTITATLFSGEDYKEQKHTAVGKINVEQAELGAITFVNVESPALSISTMANKVLPELTPVTFKVLDRFNNPISDKQVTFELTNTAGGVSLAKEDGLTDSEGLVSAMLLSGSSHLITQVKATTLANDGVKQLSTSSLPISITTGLPRQDRLSVALSVFNPGAYNVDGVAVDVTVTASDAFGNNVPDGTIINFTAESGAMASSCETKDGQCTSTWKSGGTRPGHYDPALDLVNEQVGMTTILAYTLGEAGFTDSNGNYTFDVNEPFVSYAEPFRDDNWNGSLDADATSGLNVEQFIDTNHNGEHTAASGKYQGALCSEQTKVSGHCEDLMHVRAQTRLVQSVADSIRMTLYTGCNNDLSGCVPMNPQSLTPAGGVFWVVLQDANGNIPASKASLSVEPKGYKVFGTSGEVENSTGELGVNITGSTAIPDYGQIFEVSYVPESPAESITLTAESGGAKVELLLQ